MNRNRIPCCSRCKSNYHVNGDTYGLKIPMLLNCGHDMCKNCLKFLFKRNRQVICEICQTDSMIKCENEVLNAPIHYYLVGKVLSLSFNKYTNISHDIENLKIRNINTELLQSCKKNCYLCQKSAIFFCGQCNEMYCKNCSQQVHVTNQMSHHEVENIHFTDPEFPLESNCDQHSKLTDFICVTCDLLICSICAIENHRPHDIQPLEKYNMSEMQRLNEFSSKGDILLKKLTFHKNYFSRKIYNYESTRKKKINNYDIEKQKISTFTLSVIGALQRLEYKFLNMLDEADQANINSMYKIQSQLDNLIEDLQEKLSQIDTLFKKKLYSCNKMLPNAIYDIERILDATYFIAKNNKIDTSIFFDETIFESINQCIVSEIETSDAYILTNSPELPLNYSLTSTIEVINNALSERTSSVSSCISTISSEVSTPSSDVIKPSKSSYSSIKEITQNVTEFVVITHTNSPSDFYVQLLANNEIMTMITDELYKFIQTENSLVEIISMDNMMYAIQARNDRWYRGFVVHINNNEIGDCFYTVYCIDYGFTDILTTDRIRNVPASVISIPPLAYNCALYDLKPSTVSGWSNGAYKLFTELILEKNGLYYINPMDLSGEQIKVDLIWKDSKYPLSIRDAMFYMGHGSSAENFVNKELHKELLSLITLPNNIQLKEETEYPVVISHLITPHEFYMRIMDDETNYSLEETMNTLDTIYKPTESHFHKSYLLYTPLIGMIVAARYSIDSNWYRAKITSLPEPRMVTVFYIDYGNSETLPWDQLRVLDKSLIKIPPLAVKASLTDIEPAIDGIECDKWSSQSCTEFMNLLRTDYIQDNLSAWVQKIDFDTHKVVLFSRTLRREICVNSQLLHLGHATTLHPTLCVFNKKNIRAAIKSSLYINSREKIKINSTEDSLAFVKQRSVINSKNHLWSNKENKKYPGYQMSVIKIVSPDEITLKYINYNTADLTERMNKAYSKNKKIKKLDWKENDLCAVFIHKFGNWYRGKIIKLDSKKTATIYLYDLDETYDQLPLIYLEILKQNFVEEKCGILHCSMNNLIPLGVSDEKWPKFSCDRLIEELKKYPIVYLLKCGKRGNIVLGEIWVKDVNSPQALEPLNERWLNMNKFMVEQGFALNKKQAGQDDEYLTFLPELEFNNTFEIFNNDLSINSWLPPIPITMSKVNATGTYVDNKGLIYFQPIDNDTPQLLQSIVDKLNLIFMNSQPEPINLKWSNGQMVIAKYHLDNLWYRGIILEVKNDDLFSVQFIDYGNIEDCSRENLRSTLYMTDIPQLCVKGYFYNIIPVTKNNKWSTLTLDFIHCLVVDKHLQVTVDLEISKENIYTITSLKSNDQSDICQYLVSNNHAYFASIDKSKLQFFDYPISSDTAESYDSTESNDNLFEHLSLRSEELYNSNGNCMNSMQSSNTNNIDHEEMNNKILQNSNADVKKKIIRSTEISKISAYNHNVPVNMEENNEKYMSESHTNDLDYESDTDNVDNVKEKKDSYSKFCLESSDETEGILCTVTEPTRMTLMITKISGVCLSKSKDEMHRIMFEKCPELPVINQITPGTAVVVIHNILWRRGIIVNGGHSVFLVDLGKSIKLIKKNVRLCPNEFFHLPMLSMDCQLENIKISEYADTKDVIKAMSNLLRGKTLKIVGIDKFDEDIISVELYNDHGEIVYQPLIDSKLLILKN